MKRVEKIEELRNELKRYKDLNCQYKSEKLNLFLHF